MRTGRQLYYVRVLRSTFDALRTNVRTYRTTNVERSMIPTVVLSARGEQRLRERPSVDLPRRRRRRPGGAAATVSWSAAPRGRTLGYALYSDRSQIALRMLTYGEQPADDALAAGAGSRRRSRSGASLGIDATAYRLVHGEADLLPSLIVDRYGDYLVVQALSQGMDRLLPLVVDAPERAARSRAASSRATIRARGRSKGSSSGSTCCAGEVPDSVDRRARPASSTTSTSAAGRRPGCSSISARTAKPRRATRAAGCSTASATTAGLR